MNPTLLLNATKINTNPTYLNLCVFRIQDTSPLILLTLLTQSLSGLFGHLPDYISSQTLHIREASSLIPQTLLAQSLTGLNSV